MENEKNPASSWGGSSSIAKAKKGKNRVRKAKKNYYFNIYIYIYIYICLMATGSRQWEANFCQANGKQSIIVFPIFNKMCCDKKFFSLFDIHAVA
jgi:hypothetical protein